MRLIKDKLNTRRHRPMSVRWNGLNGGSEILALLKTYSYHTPLFWTWQQQQQQLQQSPINIQENKIIFLSGLQACFWNGSFLISSVKNQHTRELISARKTTHKHNNKDQSRQR